MIKLEKKCTIIFKFWLNKQILCKAKKSVNKKSTKVQLNDFGNFVNLNFDMLRRRKRLIRYYQPKIINFNKNLRSNSGWYD